MDNECRTTSGIELAGVSRAFTSMGLSLSLFSCRWRPSQVKGREEPRRDARDLRPSPFLSFYLLPTHNTNLAMPGTFFFFAQDSFWIGSSSSSSFRIRLGLYRRSLASAGAIDVVQPRRDIVIAVRRGKNMSQSSELFGKNGDAEECP